MSDSLFSREEKLPSRKRAEDIVRRFNREPCGCCVKGDAAELTWFIQRAIDAAVMVASPPVRS